MSELRWKAVLDAIDGFRSYLAPTLPPLRLLHACDKRWTDDEYRRLRPDRFPSRLRGVYLIFDDSESLLYVGVATDCFDKRVWSHDDKLPRCHTDIVPFEDRLIFLAPALEYYLITKLRPPGNKLYASRLE